MQQKELKIDPELRDLLPPLTGDEYKQLEKNIVENGFDKNFPIMEWHGFIVDGHNRYSICKKHNIEYVVGTLGYETKDEVMEWMLDIQLGRRNLSPIQRIAVAEKYRPIYEKQAKERQATSTGGANPQLTPNLVEADKTNNRSENETNSKLAKIANVGKETYRQAKRVLDSNNEELKNRVLSGETSISAGYKELQNEKKKEQFSDNQNEEYNIEQPTTSSSIVQPSQKNQVSEEVRQICEDLKTEKSKEYLDSIWDYKIDIIECMNIGFERFYDGFVSILSDMENRVTKSELDECIANAENNITKLLTAIELAKKTTLKTED
jgi:hypothetical protein